VNSANFNSANFGCTEFYEVRHTLATPKLPQKIHYLGDVLERTSLIRCLLIQAGRGLEPHLGKSGHLGGVGSQWCNRLYRVEPPIIRGGKGRDRRALFASYLTYALPKTLRPTKATEERS
jgi:hypothetical protein